MRACGPCRGQEVTRAANIACATQRQGHSRDGPRAAVRTVGSRMGNLLVTHIKSWVAFHRTGQASRRLADYTARSMQAQVSAYKGTDGCEMLKFGRCKYPMNSFDGRHLYGNGPLDENHLHSGET